MNGKNELLAVMLMAAFFVIGQISPAFGQETTESLTQKYNDAISIANEDPVESATVLAGLLTDDGTVVLLDPEVKGFIEDKLPKIQYNAGNALFKEKKYSDALGFFEASKASAEEFENEEVGSLVGKALPKAYYAVGMSHLKNKSYDDAMASFEKAVELNPKYANAHFGISRVYRAKSDLDNVYKYTDKALELAGEKTKANIVKSISGYLYKKAKGQNEKSNYDDAITLLEKAITYDAARDQARYYYELGKAYQGLGRISDACGAYKKATGKYAEGAKYQMEHKLKCG